jgi:methylmalonyl-CoA/ethylmalonyl-CoA epimerase
MSGPATFDHVAIAVRSIRKAVRLFVDVLGAEYVAGGDDERLHIRTVQLKLPPGVKIELMEPIGEDSYLARFIEKHGEGFHHTTLFFENIEEVIPELEEKGFHVVDTDLSDPSWRETFVRPSVGFGTLLQIVDTNYDWMTKSPYPIEDVLDGKIIWRGSDLIHRDDVE